MDPERRVDIETYIQANELLGAVLRDGHREAFRHIYIFQNLEPATRRRILYDVPTKKRPYEENVKNG